MSASGSSQTLKGKTLLVTGASRGIGLAIALRAARDGANIVIAAKSDKPDPRLPGTIHTAAQEVVAAGGRALAIATDIRDEAQVDAAVAAAMETFGGIDIVVNNASAMFREPTLSTDMKRFDLLFDINVRGTYMVTRKCLPDLLQSPTRTC
jgi:citronellol/citronellal dehydrogenase